MTDQCISSIYSSTWRDKFEVIVVDNNSSDGSVEMIREKYPEVKIIENKDNKLFAIANNQGAKIARGEYLLLLNSDTIVYDDNLQKMMNFLDGCEENVICIGPKILNTDKSLQSYGFVEWGNILHHVLNLFHINRVFPIHRLIPTMERNPYRTHQVGWVVGACMMMRKGLYDKVGGLNENLFFYGEEPEFGYRTKKLGYKTLYFSDAEIIHLGGASTEKDKMLTFEKDIAQYDSLISETVGVRKAISINRWTRFALKIKSYFHLDKEYFKRRLTHEKRVGQYFKNRLKSDI